MGKTGLPIKYHAMMYKAVVQAVLLYVSEIWGATETMMTALEEFHHIIARRMAGMTPRKGDGDKWEWASVDAALEVTGIWPIKEYMRRRQATITEYVSGRSIYEIFTGSERM